MPVAGNSNQGAATVVEAISSTTTAVALECGPASRESSDEITADRVRNTVLAALEDSGQQMLAHNLESGEWAVRGLEVSVKVAMSEALIDVALGAEPRRIIQTALTNGTGKPMLSAEQIELKPASPRPANGVGARSRAMSDPAVQRMREKFGAEIRTVIDHKER
jgi:hypothetical protein